MAGALNQEEELVWDPLYPSLQAYAKHFDYDLLGQKVRRTARFFAHPQSHIERWVREQQMEIIAIGASLMLSVIILFLCKAVIIRCIVSSLRSLRYFLALRSISKKYKKALKTCDYENADADVFAAEVYRKVVETRNLYKYRDKTDMIEYDSGRFNWETIRKTGLAYEELLKKKQLEGEATKKSQGAAYKQNSDWELSNLRFRSFYRQN
ncbi:conserved hypothetical protein [Echinococcus multilocularis]|uniref:Uncharacterized protein n=1 Tax=Echinococcus multilocularis TaxID=6211 RepID=A0A068Y964_ECHMU|nr:conserved hypothetical protein [Echinococcus multilocularis]